MREENEAALKDSTKVRTSSDSKKRTSGKKPRINTHSFKVEITISRANESTQTWLMTAHTQYSSTRHCKLYNVLSWPALGKYSSHRDQASSSGLRLQQPSSKMRKLPKLARILWQFATAALANCQRCSRIWITGSTATRNALLRKSLITKAWIELMN